MDFTQLGIAPGLLAIIRRLGFSTPTPIQEQSIPVAIDGKDLVGIAQTGTGKTLAFGVPMIQRLASARRAGGPVSQQGLVVVPTRELALQVDEALRRVGESIGLKTAVLIGGAGMRPQITALRYPPHIIVATPGRLIDHLNQKNVSLARVSVLVLDEADRMLDMGFLPQIKKILDALPKERQTMLFSATMPRGIMNIATRYMKTPVRVEVAPSGTAVDKVTQELFIVPKEQKQHLLNTLLTKTNGSTLIFSRTKYGAKKIMRNIKALGITAAEIHSNRTLGQRREALEGFKMGKYRVLVATDIASRGIDVLGIAFVINYDLPGTPDDYVHRIGRTARAGATGHAITFASASELRGVHDIERLIRQPIPKSTLPELPRVAARPFDPSTRTNFGTRHGFGTGNSSRHPARRRPARNWR